MGKPKIKSIVTPLSLIVVSLTILLSFLFSFSLSLSLCLQREWLSLHWSRLSGVWWCVVSHNTAMCTVNCPVCERKQEMCVCVCVTLTMSVGLMTETEDAWDPMDLHPYIHLACNLFLSLFAILQWASSHFLFFSGYFWCWSLCLRVWLVCVHIERDCVTVDGDCEGCVGGERTWREWETVDFLWHRVKVVSNWIWKQ